MNETVVRISQGKLAELILSQIQKQVADIPGIELPGAVKASQAFASAMYELWSSDGRVMSDEDALTGLGFMAEAFESITSDLCEAHFAEEN